MPRGEFDRSERRARTRAQLLEAAARVYARRGFDIATLDEIAEEAGFTKGAVYDHFGSKENLLFALLDEHLSAQIAEQVALFDETQETTERPRVGADRWMKELDENPDVFRLFVEAWVRAQRDDSVRGRVAAGVEAWREMFMSFGRRRSEQLGTEPSKEALEEAATVMVGLGVGLAMVRLVDADAAPPRLLGAAAALLIAALESDEDARTMLAKASRT
jgi:AcrR family transcriptional regulator